MIRLKLPAEMACDDEGCTATLDVRLILLTTGTFGFAPVGRPDWQVQVDRNNPMSPYLARCPKHAQQVLAVPEKKVLVNAH